VAVFAGIVVATTPDIDDGVDESSKQQPPTDNGIIIILFVMEFISGASKGYCTETD